MNYSIIFCRAALVVLVAPTNDSRRDLRDLLAVQDVSSLALLTEQLVIVLPYALSTLPALLE